MLLRPEHANPTPLISTLHQMPTSPSLSASSPPPTAHRPPRSDPSQTGRHRRLGSPAPNPSPLDLRPDLQLHRRFDVIVLNSFQDQLVLNSIVQPSSSPEMEFVVIDFRS
ncbi:hypothetical protein PS2_036048 [Malus domestica]